MQLEMQHKTAEEMDEASRAHEMQIQAARLELDRAIEIARHKVNLHQTHPPLMSHCLVWCLYSIVPNIKPHLITVPLHSP